MAYWTKFDETFSNDRQILKANYVGWTEKVQSEANLIWEWHNCLLVFPDGSNTTFESFVNAEFSQLHCIFGQAAKNP